MRGNVAAVITLMTAMPLAQADTLRCGSQLVGTGDRTFEVERKCGYSLGRNERHELKLEEWARTTACSASSSSREIG